ncbi:hypothetical protein E2C01_078687 [Portunus trituberculatus]|uniref:Uncharacterized protein n=1 Tax=Portunus trituberculatus TaxID=210409 RepID=A0A5B7IUS4_PORTR|nr:hypothetical protein [Portunus trituberculatus]
MLTDKQTDRQTDISTSTYPSRHKTHLNTSQDKLDHKKTHHFNKSHLSVVEVQCGSISEYRQSTNRGKGRLRRNTLESGN